MEKQRYGIALVLSICTIVITACTHKANGPVPVIPAGNNSGSNDNNIGDNGTNPADTSLCFSRDILPIFIANCAMNNCHDAASAEDGYVFANYETITRRNFSPGNAKETKLYRAITERDEDDRMPRPPLPRLSQQQINLIGRWINEGAKNTSGCGVLCDSNNFTYSNAVKPLADKYCRGCHSGSAPSGGVVLDSYDGVRNVTINGKLLITIKHLPGATPMPRGGNKLSDCEIRQIEKWAAAGAPDN